MNKYYIKIKRTKYDVAKDIGFTMLLSISISLLLLFFHKNCVYSYLIVLAINVLFLLFLFFFYSSQRSLIFNNDEFLVIVKKKEKILRFRYPWNSIELVSYTCMNIHTRGGWTSNETIYVQGKKRKVGIKDIPFQKTIVINDFTPFSFKKYIGTGKGYYNKELNNILQQICKFQRIKYLSTVI